jgi:histidinol-phosphate aminotransferase
MDSKRATNRQPAGISRRSFLTAAAGGAGLALLGGGRTAAGKAGRAAILSDYVGRLCYNENPLGPSPLAIAAMNAQVSMGHRYPDWYADSLRADLAIVHGVSSSRIIAGCGATEILNLAALAFADPGGNVVCPYPSYSQFPSDCSFLGSEVRYSDLDQDYRVDLNHMASLVDSQTTAVCITNANNPTATVLSASAIADFIDALPSHVAVIIDEAYHEFIHDAGYESAMEQVRLNKNVVVIRTFSKVFGLAGVRIGYAVGKSDLIGSMNAWHIYATVSRLALEAARAALTDAQHIADTVSLNDDAKAYCFNAFDAMGLSYIPSETNYFMVDVGQPAGTVSSELAARGIRVRTGWGMPNHLRVSTGTMEEMESFITALMEILELANSGELDPRVNSLEGNFPNPAARATRIPYALADRGHVVLQIFDIHGRLVKTIVDKTQGRGRHAVDWKGTNQRGESVAAGSYFYRLNVGDFTQTRRLILVD